ncbi:MAG: HIT family protein [Bdellovibrionaceae bacterium]|nr:HIT family protein [Pseudobdellovibrionaceae bacterium]
MHHRPDCVLCRKIQACDDRTDATLIEEFKHSFFVLGDHQFFKGYSMVVVKDHVRDMMDLPGKLQMEVLQEVMFASRALQETFQPWKLNHASLGNVVTHIHWHIFPRYEDDPDLLQHPWFHSAEFDHHKISADLARERATLIRSHL